MSKLTRSLVAVAAGLFAVGLIGISPTAVGANGNGTHDSGVVYQAYTRTTGGFGDFAGSVRDKLFGAGAVTYAESGTSHITAKPFVLYFRNGTLTGSATDTITYGTNGAATLTNGKLTVAHGTAGQKGHSLTATFSGSGNTNTGRYKVVYTGTYK